MSQPIRSISAHSLVDQVSVELRRSIANGNLAPGKPISISDLAGYLGVSHIPVREALRRLESEGLVEMRPSKGAGVRPLEAAEVKAIYRLRLLIEPTLASWSAPLFSADDLSELESLLSVYEDPEMEIADELAAHNEFHLAIIGLAASEWDTRVLDYLWNANMRYARLLFDPHDENVRAKRLRTHKKLLTAARSGLPERLERAVRTHLVENEKELLDNLAAHDDEMSA